MLRSSRIASQDKKTKSFNAWETCVIEPAKAERKLRKRLVVTYATYYYCRAITLESQKS
jgi:hypothetical protein